MRVKPADPTGVIRDPHTRQVLAAEGGDVPENVFWIRRLRDGSVVRVEEPTAPTDEEPTAKEERIDAPAKPVGNEPIPPLTTREGK